MTEKELIDKLNELRSLSAENEVVEFKEAKNSYDFRKLGKYFSAEAKIRWLLKDSKGNNKDYHIESCPMLLAIDKIYAKIRNLKYRYIKDGTLFPDEVDQYEPFVIREAINNCIAHQDYTKGGRINVVEMEDQLIFTNLGSFIPGSVGETLGDVHWIIGLQTISCIKTKKKGGVASTLLTIGFFL